VSPHGLIGVVTARGRRNDATDDADDDDAHDGDLPDGRESGCGGGNDRFHQMRRVDAAAVGVASKMGCQAGAQPVYHSNQLAIKALARDQRPQIC